MILLSNASWRQQLAFRDALRADPRLVQRYAALKKGLASQYVNDREAYTAGKADFIAAVLGVAMTAEHDSKLDSGIARRQRRRQYSETLHGGNVGLAALVTEKGTDYVRNNLSFALLEFWSMRTEDQHVLDREAYWKQVLVSRSLGLNRN